MKYKFVVLVCVVVLAFTFSATLIASMGTDPNGFEPVLFMTSTKEHNNKVMSTSISRINATSSNMKTNIHVNHYMSSSLIYDVSLSNETIYMKNIYNITDTFADSYMEMFWFIESEHPIVNHNTASLVVYYKYHIFKFATSGNTTIALNQTLPTLNTSKITYSNSYGWFNYNKNNYQSNVFNGRIDSNESEVLYSGNILKLNLQDLFYESSRTKIEWGTNSGCVQYTGTNNCYITTVRIPEITAFSINYDVTLDDGNFTNNAESVKLSTFNTLVGFHTFTTNNRSIIGLDVDFNLGCSFGILPPSISCLDVSSSIVIGNSSSSNYSNSLILANKWKYTRVFYVTLVNGVVPKVLYDRLFIEYVNNEQFIQNQYFRYVSSSNQPPTC